MIGAIAGDIIGSVFENDPIKTKDFPLFSECCRFTDDTIHTVALAKSILTGESYAVNLKKFYHLYPDAGYGYRFYLWATCMESKPYDSWGNGASMRISPAGYAFNNLETLLQKTKEFTEITHSHSEGIKGAQATAAAIFLARTGKSKDDIKNYVENKFNYDLSKNIDEIRPSYHFDVSCQGTVPQAIRAFIDSTSFEDAIRTAVSLGGDSDTLACITGSIAEVFYGDIPVFIEKRVYEILDERLGKITKQFVDKYIRKEN